MLLRINDVTVSPSRIDELADVLTNKARPIVVQQKGYQGLSLAADRATGNCAIVSFWDSRKSLDESEKAIGTIRSEVIDALDARLNNVTPAEVLREVMKQPSQVGTRTRVVRITAPADQARQMVDFYEKEVIPRIEAEAGFLNARLIQDQNDPAQFAGVSHWKDTAALDASEKVSATLRGQIPTSVPGASVERVSTAEIVLIERTT